ncbi:MAG: META domain-containing protein [Novosphingobium sp.]|uniref:META domain-containing protein n=1 Tax=Novosphingobium sp. TaxID=1874826 RepID=UPI0012CC3A9D|nr:META domain-containing protein [Novosphingobium sp.]MPS70658.1 META domain-containing protein [Novosphingobium sp.]
MRAALLAFCLLSPLTACSIQGEDSPLARTSWRFALIDGQRPESNDARLTFEGSKVGVLVGCNRMDGPWRIDEERLIAGPLTLTETTCTIPAWDQEKAVNALLVATPRFAIDGNHMILQSSGHTAELVREGGPVERPARSANGR